MRKSEIDELREMFDQVLAEVELEAQDRINYDVHAQWCDRYYLRHGCLIERTSHKSLHYAGTDRLQHECPVCKKRLSLLLDVDCAAPCFRKEQAPIFKGLVRLPLLYCFRCAGTTTYRVFKNRIQLFPTECTAEDSPFEPDAENQPPTPMTLKRIDREIEDLLALAQHVTKNWLSRTQQRRVMKSLGKKFPKHVTLDRSQFGGLPYFHQGYRDYACKNERCKTHKMGLPFFSHGVKFKMKALASIGPEVHRVKGGEDSQVIFQICWCCNTVTAEYDGT